MTAPQIDEQIAQYSQTCTKLIDEVGRVLVGQEAMVSRLLIGMLTGGHILLEGVPGLAKTLTVSSLAKAIHTGFSRIQFTPDMLPADVIGTEVFNPKEATYSIKQGPIFSNLILADEINRAPAKVQAALLEAMQERQVTIGTETFRFEDPFLVMATQNPIDQEGTYPLPEAQVDRFMLKVMVDYPTRDEERKVVDRMAGGKPMPEISAIATPEDIMGARGVVEKIWCDDKVRDYVVDVVRATRNPAELGVRGLEGMIETGASPRGSLNLMKASKAHAFLQGRNYITPHDVKSLAPDVLRHRVMLSYEAEAEGKTVDDCIRQILDNVPVP
ncbi:MULTISPECIES: AAA family ATPase [Rosistilla]|uniref:ATPase family associated with various cellular activities (AAA) n=2 Tax=Rosistilla TaxID=2795779 RepID=A0A518IVB6_9BACT|nr:MULTISPECIES: MoxR family ATPase [Rosistilla]QDV57024.1 ATPase family associated with various cellular activities (AAA) [Rosistilla oblonga]QDV71522.1 ATPase family associated with various cellular activities (AAA) [Rosistilla carotiformis]